jgi:hypothetical protein
MRKLFWLFPLFGLSIVGCTPSVTLYAQTVPATVHASYDFKGVAISYKIALDGGTPIVVPASACTASPCLTAVTVPTFGNHVMSEIVTFQLVSSDPTSITDSPPLTFNWSLNQGTPTGLAVTK